MNRNWYVLAVHPRKEGFVEQQLRSYGFKVVNPGIRKIITHARSRKNAVSPLFPGYVFVEIDIPSQNWRLVNSIPGSIGLLSCDTRPSPLKRQFVEVFVSSVGTDGVIRFNQDLEIGDRVQTLGGHFDRYAGEVIGMSSGDRIKVLMEGINRKIEMTLPRTAVFVAA